MRGASLSTKGAGRSHYPDPQTLTLHARFRVFGLGLKVQYDLRCRDIIRDTGNLWYRHVDPKPYYRTSPNNH